MVKKYTTHKSLKGWVRVLIKIIILVFFAIGLFLIFTSLNLSKPKEEILMSYDIEQNLSYNVNLYENNYISNESLSKIDNYITSLVSNIDLNFNYIYEATKPGNYNYNYMVNATLYGEYHGNADDADSKLWIQEYNLLPNTIKEVYNVNSFSIDENINLNFQSFNAEVVNFKSALNVPINAYLEVVMNIKVNGEANSCDIIDSKTQKFVIPLNQVTFKIKKDEKKDDHQTISHTEDKLENDMLRFDVGIVFIVYSFTMLILTFKFIFRVKGKSKFDVELNRILKSYGDVIVELITPINLSNKDVVLVKSFNEMLDLEEELRTPINFIRVSDNVGEFLIINNEICYKWILEE